MYLLSILSVIILTGFMCATTFGMDGSYLLRLFNGSTILFLILFLIPLLISAGLLRDFNHAFRLVIGKKEVKSLIELKRAKESVSLTIKILLILSVFICALQGVLIIYNADDPAMFGPYFSTALLTLIYGMGITLILLPLQARLNIKIQEYINQ